MSRTGSRVVYVIGQLSVGGTERQLVLLASGLRRLGWQVTVVCLRSAMDLAPELERAGCSVVCLARGRGGRIGRLMALRRLLQRERPDIVHGFGHAWYFALLAGLLAGRPRIVAGERAHPEVKPGVFRRVDRFALSRVDAVIANARVTRRELVRDRRLPPDRGFVIPNAIDLDPFDGPGRAERDDGSDTFTIVTVANLDRLKGHLLLLDAFARARRARPGLVLWLIGDGPERGTLERAAAARGIADDVVFWGSRADVPALLRDADVGVTPSITEGLCNAIMEYMASGLPVVATDVGGNGELVVDGETGYLVAPGDAAALAAAIVRLAEEPATAARLGGAGRLRIEGSFLPEAMARSHDAVYRSLMR